MAEATEGSTSKKKETTITPVQMKDGRTVQFVGKRRIDKDYSVDESKLTIGGDGEVLLAPGAVKVRIDFLNGETVNFTPPASIIAQALGHGLVQKLGDEAASEKEVDDAYEAIADLAHRLGEGKWTVARESGGFSGASMVVRALMEISGKSQEEVRQFLDTRLAALQERAKSEGKKEPSRADFYKTFRNPESETGKVIKRLEDEKARSITPAFDADAEAAALKAA